MVGRNQIISDIKDNLIKSGFKSEIVKKMLANLIISSNIEQTIKDVSVVAILTEWEKFKNFNWDDLPNSCKIFDGRNFLSSNNFKIETL